MKRACLVLPLIALASAARADNAALNEQTVNAFHAHIERCWSPSPDQMASGTVVKIHLQLDQTGFIREMSIPDSERDKYITDALYRDSANAAMTAFFNCGPVRDLPKANYNSWKVSDVTLDPRNAVAKQAPAKSQEMILQGPPGSIIPSDQIQ